MLKLQLRMRKKLRIMTRGWGPGGAGAGLRAVTQYIQLCLAEVTCDYVFCRYQRYFSKLSLAL